MKRLLDRLSAHRPLTVTLTVAGFLLTVLPHEQVNDRFLGLLDRLGLAAYNRLMGAAALGGFLLVAAALARALLRGRSRRAKVLYAAACTLPVLASFPTIIAVNSEAVHFLQYGLLAVPLFALTRRFGQTVAWATLLGTLDEAYQYWVLHPDWEIYLDFNDIVLNTLGAGLGAAALAIAAGASAPRRRPPLRATILSVPFLLGAGLLLAAVLSVRGGLVGLHPDPPADPAVLLSRSVPSRIFWTNPGDWGRRFHILSPLEGVAAIVILHVLHTAADHRLSIGRGGE